MSLDDLKRNIADALQRRDYATAHALCDTGAGQVAAEDLCLLRGIVALQSGDVSASLSHLAQAFSLAPSRADIAYNYGVALHSGGHGDPALQAWLLAAKLDPQCLPAWQNAGILLRGKGDLAAARSFYAQALSFHPQDKILLCAYGTLCHETEDDAEAQRIFAFLAETYPDDVEININAGEVFARAGWDDRAETCFRRAIAAGGDKRDIASYNLSHVLLAQRRWREGFGFYESRLTFFKDFPPPWGLPRWQPDLPPGSSVLLWNDQGLGDVMMFARFAPLLRDRGYRISAFVQKPLQRLLATMDCFDAIIDVEAAPQPFDAALPFASLPLALNLSPEQANATAYLKPPANLPFDLPGSGFRIGIVWSGNPTHSNDKNRSIPLATLAPLFDLPTTWISLQKGLKTTVGLEKYLSIFNAGPLLNDLADTAAVMDRLDLIITVDTAAAHLAGALGKKAWVLLPHRGVDWRWGRAGTQSLWYPSLHLIRQDAKDGWSATIAVLRQELIKIIGSV